MTPEEIHRRIDFMRSIKREHVHLPIATVEKLMGTAIGKATIKDGKLSPVRKGSKIQKSAAKKKAARKVAGLQKNRAAVKARKG